MAVGLVGEAVVFLGMTTLRPATPTAKAYLRAWDRADYRAMAARVENPPPDFAARHQQMTGSLSIVSSKHTLGTLVAAKGRATADVSTTVELAGLGTWTYDGHLNLHRQKNEWRVVWMPTTIHPRLAPQLSFQRTRTRQQRGSILAADGSVLADPKGPKSPTSEVGGHIIGRLGPVTADLLKQLGPDYVAGDVVGLTGLEQGQEKVLAGTPSGDVTLVDATGKAVAVLDHIAGRPPANVQTSLDLRIQRAAESALGPSGQPAALVAIKPSTGEILAAVNRPIGGFGRALAGKYPPGSTFKVLTAAALLQKGIKPDDAVTCPPTATVGGRKFSNFEGETAAGLTFRKAFAISCNTAFIGLASSKLSGPDLLASAALFGFNSSPSIGMPAYGGTIPGPADIVELAAEAIGQAKVQVSPLQMASVAAAVASGTWRPPSLVAGSSERLPSHELPGVVVSGLRDFMAAVVQSGTGTAAALPGAPVSGKTGTAEFGTASPPATHAWFIGFRGDLAFAVLVEGGGVGGRVAAPLARRFLAGV
jgi:cell division protein FtsI/penicillin-binding protein 2